MVSGFMDIPKQKLSTITAILKSRRLLSDHSEALEECLSNDYNSAEKSTKDKYFNGTNCTLLITSAIITSKFVNKRLGITLCAISSGCAIMCLPKVVFCGKLWILHNSIITLLEDIDRFDAYMRRSISYFRENALFQSTHQSSMDNVIGRYSHLFTSFKTTNFEEYVFPKIKLTKTKPAVQSIVLLSFQNRKVVPHLEKIWKRTINNSLKDIQSKKEYEEDATSNDLINCTKSIIAVIECFASVVIYLEIIVLPSKIDHLFQPLENLNEYLQRTSSNESVSNLKELYNVFLYVQSHLLTRLSLLLIYNHALSQHLPKNKCSILSRVLKDAIRDDDLRYEQMTSTPTNNSNHPNSIDHVTMEPMLNLKSYSISASSKILAIANECRRIDGIVQNVHQLHKDELNKLMPSITQIENAIHICQSEYQRFVVAYFKVMNIEYKDQCCDGRNLNSESEFAADDETLREFKEIEPDEEEFFTSTERTSDDESKDVSRNRRFWDDELTEKNINVVKQRFKPVLAQLKGKIEPIATSLRERERNHLLSKGIDPSEFVDCNNINEGDFRSCSDSDDETEFIRHRKPNRTTYDDMRKFLEGKPQISLIPMRNKNESFLKEDILEESC